MEFRLRVENPVEGKSVYTKKFQPKQSPVLPTIAEEDEDEEYDTAEGEQLVYVYVYSNVCFTCAD